MAIDVIVPESTRKVYESWHFASAVRHDNLIFCSGVVGRGESAEEEFRNAWQSLGETLAEAGVGYEDIIDTTIYMVDLQKNAGAMAKVKDEFIKEPYYGAGHPRRPRRDQGHGSTEILSPEHRARDCVFGIAASDTGHHADGSAA
jgi:enamine deaminase RidA (YjgF/YER057c/UK114 family)